MFKMQIDNMLYQIRNAALHVFLVITSTKALITTIKKIVSPQNPYVKPEQTLNVMVFEDGSCEGLLDSGRNLTANAPIIESVPS